MDDSFLGELLELAREIQAGVAAGTVFSPDSRALGDAAMQVLRHRLGGAPLGVQEELILALETRLAAAREAGAVLDPVVEAMCELVLRESPE